tara:strand:+ start:40793 stop:41416 length:624 start_codon:yes stop_codon:yes gene_type:complete
MTLYKYKNLYGDGLLHALDIIVNKRIYLSTCSEMNDTEEGDWDGEEIYNQNSFNITYELRNKVNSIRFTSLTDTCTDVLLWAYYAGGFSGVVFEFEINENKYDIRKMKYDGKAKLSLDQMKKIIDGEIKVMDTGILISKAPSWTNENEYRLFHECNSDNPYIEIVIKKVIFGLKGEKIYAALRDIVRKYEIPVNYLNKNSKNEYIIC